MDRRGFLGRGLRLTRIPGSPSDSDGASGAGFRGQLGAALKFRLSEIANLETFAEADYFSDVGTAHMANNQPGDTTASHTGSTDLFELRAGARLSIGLTGN